ncbi:hypothetical protein [uncultured Kordia sp.]|uniref:hypothetical protein n=1 Tax=uncultured Kordia sp. TaxID=507699 RepID=UPI00261F698D|nr:hypothetical protein [uncultured Kordia sp.]
MKKKNLKLLILNKKSISNLVIYGGAAPPRATEDTLYMTMPEEEEKVETFARMCATTVITTYCPSALCY